MDTGLRKNDAENKNVGFYQTSRKYILRKKRARIQKIESEKVPD